MLTRPKPHSRFQQTSLTISSCYDEPNLIFAYDMTENTSFASTSRASSIKQGNYQSLSTSEQFSHNSSSSSSKSAPVPFNITIDSQSISGKSSYSKTENVSLDPFESYSSVITNSTSATPNEHQFHGKKLGLTSLVVLSFYTVCGGPFGIEDIVRAGGPFYAILGFGLIFVWAVPEAMITAELSVAMPECSGSVAWVESAFGGFWAFQKGWLSWLSGIADNALYPILFLDCLLQMVSDDDGKNFLSDDDGTLRWSLLLSITAVLTYVNYRGLEVVGKLAIIICLLSLFPFGVFCVLGLRYVKPARWFLTKPGGIRSVDWRLLLNTFFWNINFWESASSFSADVAVPAKNYPRGMMIAVMLVFLSLLLPVLVGVGAMDEGDDFDKWTDGYFVHLAVTIVGPWLGYWLTFAAMITNIGMFEAEMSSDAWQVAGMADKGILPSFLSTRNKHGSPTYGVMLSAMGVIALGWLAFGEVIEMLNLVYCYGQLIEFAAYIQLRLRQDHELAQPNHHLTNPIEFYYSTPMMIVLLLLPTMFIFVILWFSSTLTFVLSTVFAGAGVGVYYLLAYMKEHKCCHFNDWE